MNALSKNFWGSCYIFRKMLNERNVKSLTAHYKLFFLEILSLSEPKLFSLIAPGTRLQISVGAQAPLAIEDLM